MEGKWSGACGWDQIVEFSTSWEAEAYIASQREEFDDQPNPVEYQAEESE